MVATLGIVTAIQDEKEKRDLITVYRVYGGKAGLVGSKDATEGSYWTTQDPRQFNSKEKIRDEYALPPKWGNTITDVAIGQIEAGNPAITSWGTATPEKEGDVTYEGGAPEMTIRDSLKNIRNIKREKLKVD